MSHVDQPRIEEAVRGILLAVGGDPDRDGSFETPGRVARTYRELFSKLAQDPVGLLSITFGTDHEKPALVRGIELASCCERHLLPFFGMMHVGYIPGGGRMTGLLKLIRLVDICARCPQVQERLITQVTDTFVAHLDAQGVIVVIEAEHTCMTMQGVRKPGSRTITSTMRGQLCNVATHVEVMNLIIAR